nr:RNA polymerase alpha subunit [Ostreobium quekettii]
MQNLIFSCIESRIEDDQTLYGCFKMGPFYLNQGLTIANTLRRILLSEVEGLSIVFLKIEGVKHEYSILHGIKESVLEILSNLKQIQFKADNKLHKPQIAYLNVKGPKIISAGDIKLPRKLQCVDPDQYIATISSDGELKIKLFICQGKRYCLQSSLKPIIQKQYQKILNIKTINYLFLDAIFLPIQQVNFTLEENNDLNKEFVIFEIWTKGGVHPKQSLFKAINEVLRILIPFRKFYSLQKIQISRYSVMAPPKFKKFKSSIVGSKKNLSNISSNKFKKKLSSLDISNLNLLFPTYISLKKAKIHTILDLLQKPKSELKTIKGITNNLLIDIEKNLLILGLNLRK